jgi:S1-C subfamily serine protease
MKLKFIIAILIAVILSLLLMVLFGGYLSARLATLPIVRRFDLFKPQAPIVVTNRQEVRVNEGQDAIDAINRAKNRLSNIAVLQDGTLTVVGGAVNLTNDGYFVTASSAFPIRGGTYFVTLNSGQVAPIRQLFIDPSTNLVIFKADLTGVTVAAFANAKGLVAGEKILLMTSGRIGFTAQALHSSVIKTQTDTSQIYSSDRLTRGFIHQNVGSLIPGQASVTLTGDVAGLWDGASLVSADVIKTTTDVFFNNLNTIRRPVFGFTYRMVSGAESNVLNIPQGALIVRPDATTSAVVAGSPAAAAGLQEGDVIIQFNGTKVDEGLVLEELLERVRPAERVNLTVVREKKQVNLTLTAGEILPAK